MQIEQFWSLIDNSIRDAKGDFSRQIQFITKELSDGPLDDISDYYVLYNQLMDRSYRYDLWGAAYIIGGGCSDDSFMDFRAWLISRGRLVFENTLHDPETLLTVEPGEDFFFEKMSYVAPKAYEARVGRKIPAVIPYSPEKPIGKCWDENELPLLFPKLCQRFNYRSDP